MTTARDLAFLSFFTGATIAGNVVGNSLVASIRSTPLAESVISTSAGIALVGAGFTLFRTFKDKHRSDGLMIWGLSLLGSALGVGGWNLILNLSTSSSSGMDPLLNSVLGYPITLGVVILCAMAFISIENYINKMVSETSRSMTPKPKTT